MAQVRIQLNGPGIRALLASPEVRTMVERKATQVQEAAQRQAVMVAGTPGEEALPVSVVPLHSGTRARALVSIDHPSGLAVEAKHRLLVGSLDAARR